MRFRHCLPLFLFAAAFLLCGCANRLIVSEVLQTPEQARIYTRYNLWYTDPMKMDTLNTLKGEILPFGTEVVITSATDREICFTTVNDKRDFRIKFSTDYRMMSAEDYLRELFSMQNEADLTVGIRALTIEKLKAGIVEKGMTRQEVELAFGPPCAFRTPSPTLDTWCFWTDFLVGKRIIFTRNVVSDILVL
ncbi:MAG: hypothetical protein J6Y92_07665 [Lentisphaeria bacterium]|nr:hypothetical protein [Lentisphaeria bacterium]